MSAFHTALQDFLESIETQSHRDIGNCAHRVLELIEHINQPDASWGLMSLVPLLADPQCPYHAMTACLCEPLLRQGGDPWLVTGLIVERLRDTLRHATEFRREFRARCRDAGADPGEELKVHGEVWKALAREQGWLAYVAGSLELFCMPALPILSHFPQAKQLFRADPQTLDCACLLAGDLPEVGELVRVLEQDPAPVEPQSVAVEAALGRLRQILPGGPDARREVAGALMELYRSLFSVDLPTRNLALRGLAESIALADAGHLGDMGQLAGSIVETGGDPDIALDAIVRRLPEVLQRAAAFVIACTQAGPGVDVPAQLELYGQLTAQRMPSEAAAFHATGSLCLGAIAMLSRSLESRKHLCGDAVILERAAALSNLIGPADFLRKMMRVLDDEELIVLDPERERGWRVVLRGVADNFQLHTLLAGTLVGPAVEGFIPGATGVAREGVREEPVPGRPLERRAVNLARKLPCTKDDLTVWSQMQMWSWPALQPDGRLPEVPTTGTDFFVWYEGEPADIPVFEDVRVVLVGPSPYLRSWNGGRVFHGMEAEFRVEETLDGETVRDLLHRIATAPRALP